MTFCGTAGTRKSFLIKCFIGSQCLLSAPTGVAAFNIWGQTLHSLLRLPLQKSNFADLSRPSLQQLQEKFNGVRHLIIDEMSIVGRQQLSLIHRRLCQTFPTQAHMSFGGVSVILFGGMGQLPPIGESPLYTNTACRGVDTNRGRQLYLTFEVVIQLRQIMRQSGNSASQVKFRERLLRLRKGQPSYEDWHDLYMSRSYAKGPQTNSVAKHSADALRLFHAMKM